MEVLDGQTPFRRTLWIVLDVDVRNRRHEPLAGDLNDELVQVHAPVLQTTDTAYVPYVESLRPKLGENLLT